MPSKSRSSAAAALGLAVALTTIGCGTNRVLLADFDKYSGTPSDDLLIGNIPGIPQGDRIENVLSFVAVTTTGLPGKSLGIDGRADLVTATHDTPDLYQVDWDGRREAVSAQPTTITFLDNDGDSALVLRFEDLALHQLTGDELEPPPFQVSPSGSHSLRVTIDTRGVGRVDVRFQEEGNEPILHGNLHFRDADFDELRAVRFEGTSASTYFMDRLSVLTKSND
jgi:hypothetical protein